MIKHVAREGGGVSTGRKPFVQVGSQLEGEAAVYILPLACLFKGVEENHGNTTLKIGCRRIKAQWVRLPSLLSAVAVCR